MAEVTLVKDWNNDDTLLFEKLEDFPSNQIKSSIHHAFFTRNGGKSKGVLSSLNASFKRQEETNIVTDNRSRIAQVMTNICNGTKNPCKFTKLDENLVFPLITVREQHTNKALNITADIIKTEYDVSTMKPVKPNEGYDGLVTNLKHVTLGIYTADCIPVLLYDPVKNVIGACHAGWKGALNGVIENTVDLMVKQYGSNVEHIEVAIGPCIHQKSYEFGRDGMKPFEKEWKEVVNKCCIAHKENVDKVWFDTVKYAKHRLIDNAKVKKENVRVCDVDVFEDERFYSYRRSRKDKHDTFGNFMSCIVMI